jgi:hypothetical protein
MRYYSNLDVIFDSKSEIEVKTPVNLLNFKEKQIEILRDTVKKMRKERVRLKNTIKTYKNELTAK